MKRWTIAEAPTPAEIEEIASVLIDGGIVLMPTDTIYGLHALIDSRAADRIKEIKGRDDAKRFVTIAANIAQLAKIGVAVSPVVSDLWPGPLTAILRRNNEESLAARIPDVNWIRALLERTGPLVSTSANRSGEPPITLPNELAHELQSALDGLVDAGLRDGKASAIVDFTGAEPRLIREGDHVFTQKLRKTLRKRL